MALSTTRFLSQEACDLKTLASCQRVWACFWAMGWGEMGRGHGRGEGNHSGNFFLRQRSGRGLGGGGGGGPGGGGGARGWREGGRAGELEALGNINKWFPQQGRREELAAPGPSG